MNCPHCGVEISEHPASRCLDAWVAEAVMGVKMIEIENHAKFKGTPVTKYWVRDDSGRLPSLYSTSIAAAWEVREALHRKGVSIELMDCRLEANADYAWAYEIYTYDNPDAVMDGVQFGTYHYKLDGSADAAPHAISRAAIKATLLDNSSDSV